jgi:D-ribose pyranose/furanose isomerase RbsD
MATYLQGVTDFIPQFQPFQPDLNFYANALQTKQNQYDTNYKALNNVYGQYFYADLTHGDNLKKKDELIKAIDFNLKRVSGLDLSLEQNVDQATQVFKPFYQDKYLMRDMAWTKNKNSEREYGMSLKNNRDEKQGKKYWEEGIRFLDYKTEEFKNGSLEDTMNMGNATYTPYVNVIEKAQKIAKDQGFHVESVDTSPDGKWMITTTNGKQILPQLRYLLEAQLGSDPGVIDVYRTQAYVNRKDYAYSNAAQFNGDKNAAEMKYLSDNYTILKAENDERKKQLEKNSQVYDNKTKQVTQAIESGSSTPDTESYLERISHATAVNSAVLATTDAIATSLSTNTGTLTTSTGFTNPYGDIESLRNKIDNGMASKLMQKDLSEAADIFVSLNSKQKVDANPFAVQEIAHGYRMQETALRNQGTREAALLRNQSDREIANDKVLYDTGAYVPDQEKYVIGPNGKQMLNPNFNRPVLMEGADEISVEKVGSGSTDIINTQDLVVNQTTKSAKDLIVPYMNQMLSSMKELFDQNLLSVDDRTMILGDSKNTITQFNIDYQKDPTGFIKKMGAQKLKTISAAFQKYLTDNNNVGINAIDLTIDKMSNLNTGVNDYVRYREDVADWRIKSVNVVKEYINKNDPKLKPYLDKAFDKEGNLLSKAAFAKNIGRTVEGLMNVNDLIATSRPGILNAYDVTESKAEINARMNKVKGADLYEQIAKAVHDAYGSSYVNTKVPAGFNPLGANIKGAGLSVDRNIMTVHAGAYLTTNAQYWNQTKKDLSNMDFGDSKSVQTSFSGPVLGVNGTKNQTAKALLDAYIAHVNKKENKAIGFKVGSQMIAAGDYSKGAMIFYPDKAFLKEYTSAKVKDENDEWVMSNLITPQEEAEILKNGISVISNVDNFQNGLMQSSYLSPLAASVKYNKEKGVTIVDPKDQTGFNTINFKVDEFGTGDYKVTSTYSVYDPNTKKYVKQGPYITSSINLGNNINAARENQMIKWDMQRIENNALFNNTNK